jgi:predicted transcriptional regulator|nr:winged helix-turn-helix domain-containing protein [Candidatus Nitrososphaera evergladensis]
MKNRSVHQILSAMLEEAEGGEVNQTMIMYKSFVSLQQLKQYLAILIDNGMLEYAAETRLYRTTEKGRAFRKAYDEVAGALRPKESRLR